MQQQLSLNHQLLSLCDIKEEKSKDDVEYTETSFGSRQSSGRQFAQNTHVEPELTQSSLLN